MRIAMIHTPLVYSAGGERQLLRLAIELQKFGHHVEIFVNKIDKDKCYPEMLKDVIVNVIPCPQFRRGVYYSTLIDMLNIAKAIPNRFDIINNHNFTTEWAAFYAKKRLKVPVVWMCNEPPFWFFHPEQRKGTNIIYWPLFEIFDKVAVSSIDEIVVLSNIAAALVKNVYKRSPTVVRTGVDTEVLQNASGENFRRKNDLVEDFFILQVGSLIYYKHPDVTIKALSYLPKEIKLVLIGVGQATTYKELASELGVKNRVLFLDNVAEEELAGIYKACNVCVFPAEQTWGLVVPEAMASGKPVIVSRKAGASEIIENNVNGIVIDDETPEILATEIKRLIDNPTLAMKMGENALNYVRNNLSWERYARNMETIFNRVIKEAKR
jgi:glycosyltransferase involved in cell wall biosynthesis